MPIEMNLPFENEFCSLIDVILDSGVKKASELRVCEQHSDLIGLMTDWCREVGLRTGFCHSALVTMQMTREDMAHDWVVYFWRVGAKANNPSPSLSRMLERAIEQGSDVLPAYMMTSVHNYVDRRLTNYLDTIGRHVTLKRRDNEEESEKDAGELPDNRIRNPHQEHMHRDAIRCMLSALGGDVLQDVVILGKTMGMKHRDIAQLILAGRLPALCREIQRTVASNLQEKYTNEWKNLLNAADSYELPEELKDLTKLVDHLYSKTDAAGRARFLRRIGGQPL